MKEYTFNISLSVLNHLGRNLYRSFMTILGEAISNAWDADAKNVYITIDRENSLLIIRDDGLGMTSEDFQNKFLKIGYSKRQNNSLKTPSGRPFIGRKGIGKLALLSCAKRISVITKTKSSKWVSGIIDNSELDKAIDNDLSVTNYKLESLPPTKLNEYITEIENAGTIIVFNGIGGGIRNRIEYLRKQLALYFRFSLLDPAFQIFVNGERVTPDDLQGLVNNTQFLWKINSPLGDQFISRLEGKEGIKCKEVKVGRIPIKGFIASVEKPSMLTIQGTGEKVSVDLYVNGRLREKDILKHIPSSRVVENYLYGQIHYNALDDEIDRFTSSREGIVPNDNKFASFLEELRTVLKGVINDWDPWRLELNQDGDPENNRISDKERKSKALFSEISKEFLQRSQSPNQNKVEGWVKDLETDAEFNMSSYGECFLAENLLRRYIKEKDLAFPSDIKNTVENLKKGTENSKKKAGISFPIRVNSADVYFCDMNQLSKIADPVRDKSTPCLCRDSIKYKPIRDAMAHTSLLTSQAKKLLETTYDNIKFRLINLLDNLSLKNDN